MTIPAELRRRLGIEGETTLTVDVIDGRLVAQPAATPDEDSWAYTPEHRARLAKARAEAAAGQILQLTESELRKRIGLRPRPRKRA
jgi:bifunctional DNA-binding transcriptional regulator/antitoxin component of YhaV-PrlF toxin-antitoxin module